MEFIAHRKTLETALSDVAYVVNTKSPMRSLSGVKLTLSEKGLELVASDQSISIMVTIPLTRGDTPLIEMKQAGAVLLSHRLFHDIIKKLDGEFVNIEIHDTLARIYDENSKFNIVTMLIDEYPQIDNHAFGDALKFQPNELAEMIRQTIFAVSVKESRPALMGINFRASNNTLELLASDTYRLSRKMKSIPEDIQFDTIIPRRCMEIVLNILDDTGDVHMVVTPKSVTFMQADWQLHSSIINGPFPDTSRLFPNNFDSTLRIKASHLISCIERAVVVTDDRNAPIRIDLSTQQVVAKSWKQEIGNFDNVLSAIYVGNPFGIAFNAQFAIDALKAIGSEDVIFYFSGEIKPIVIKNEFDDTIVQVLIPVKS